ncbi:MAG: energy-coupling factor transporter transmembrane component T [Syntrophomonas sp.]
MKLDPRTKMVMVICLSSLALIYNTPGRLFLVFAVTVALLLVFRINPSFIGGYLKPFLSLMLFLFVVQSIFSPGTKVLLALGPVSLVTVEGMLSGAGVVLRIAVVTSAALLLTTFSSRDFVLGLVQWKVPYELAFMVSTALRFLPLFRDELINVTTAVQLRGVELKKVPWGQKLATYRRLIFPVVYRTMHKAEQLAITMEARGFRAYPRRTHLRSLSFQPADYVVMMLCLGITLTLVIKELGM